MEKLLIRAPGHCTKVTKGHAAWCLRLDQDLWIWHGLALSSGSCWRGVPFGSMPMFPIGRGYFSAPLCGSSRWWWWWCAVFYGPWYSSVPLVCRVVMQLSVGILELLELATVLKEVA